MGVTEGTAGTAAATVTRAGLAEVSSGGGAGLRAAGLERAITHEVHGVCTCAKYVIHM